MFFTVFIVFFSFICLIILHEFGHFVLAKKFKVKVEEFGIGFPPRLFSKKFGETLYSLNLIPFGAFVKVAGESGDIENYQSFVGKPIWQRVLIVLGGVVSFWIVAIILLSIVAGVWGLPVAVSDEENYNLINPKVQITAIIPHSPAYNAGLQDGDVIVGLKTQISEVKTDKVGEIQKFIEIHKGREITLTIGRGKEVFERKIIPRVFPPEGEGAMGVALVRIALKPYSWHQAPIQGIITGGFLTSALVRGWVLGIKSVLGIAELPKGMKMEMMGPVGIFALLGEHFSMGINYFLFLVALISIALALVNILPIPALDGGKLLFLAIERIKGSPINQKIEERITALFFVLLIILMIFITIRFDIPRVF